MLGVDTGFRIATLESGTTLITAPMSERASVAVAFMFGIGSRSEDESNSGLAHFIEHMVFKGGRRYPSAKAVSEEIEGVGGVLNADTDRECTVFWTRVPRERLSLALDVLSDMLLHPLVDDAELVKERLVVIEELRMAEDNPQDHVHTVFDEVMWPGHPLGWDIAGREETVRSFEREQCLAHLRRHYRPDNLVVSIAGAVDHQEARAVLD
ncbi:MAG: M16 family metallopeptidase, partial [Candidatus Dormibacteria bacterium]